MKRLLLLASCLLFFPMQVAFAQISDDSVPGNPEQVVFQDQPATFTAPIANTDTSTPGAFTLLNKTQADALYSGGGASAFSRESVTLSVATTTVSLSGTYENGNQIMLFQEGLLEDPNDYTMNGSSSVILNRVIPAGTRFHAVGLQ